MLKQKNEGNNNNRKVRFRKDSVITISHKKKKDSNVIQIRIQPKTYNEKLVDEAREEISNLLKEQW